MERIDNTVSVPETWAEFTDGNIRRSQAERANSRNMRNDIQNMLNHVNDQLWKQWNAVSFSVNMRCVSPQLKPARLKQPEPLTVKRMIQLLFLSFKLAMLIVFLPNLCKYIA